MSGVFHVLEKDAAAVAKMRQDGASAEKLLDVVARAYQRARAKLTPRNLSLSHSSIVAPFAAMELNPQDLLSMVQGAARWAADAYAKTALHIESYASLLTKTTPLNTTLISLMGVDIVEAATKAGREGLAAASQAARAAAGGAQSARALAQVEHVLDAHHIVPEKWYKQFDAEFAKKLGWGSPEQMSAIAIPVADHQRALAGLWSRLGYSGAPPSTAAAGFTQVTAVLNKRLLDSAAYAALSAEQKTMTVGGIKYFIEIGANTTAKELVTHTKEVYGSEKNLAWLAQAVGPHLDELIGKL